jgi:aconitate hydratase
MQDFTGVPAVVDLAAMRAAMAKAGGDPQRSTRCRRWTW